MLLADKTIRALSMNRRSPLIEPFSPPVAGNGVISYGLTSAGYDIRLGSEIFTFKNSYGETVDPKRFGDAEYRGKVFDFATYTQGQRVPIPANGYILGNSFEYFRIPRWLKGRCTGKSTYARCGLIVNVTPLEPEWEGHLTIEISNSSPSVVYVYAYEGIAQLEFELLDTDPEVSYKDKQGKYQGQTGVTPARVV